MPPSQKERFSFTNAAAQQTKRQRFSFTDFVEPKQEKVTLSGAMDKAFPSRSLVRGSSVTHKKEEPISNKISEFFAPTRGFDIEETNKAFTEGISARDKAVGGAKFVGELGLGLSQLSRAGLEKIPGYSKLFPGDDELVGRLSEKTQPKTVGEAAFMRSIDQFTVGVGSIAKSGTAAISRRIIKAKTPKLALELAGDVTKDPVKMKEIADRILRTTKKEDSDTLASFLQKQTTTQDTGLLRDAVVKRFESIKPIRTIGKVGAGDILRETPTPKIIDDIKKTPNPTVRQLNEALEAIRVSGRRADDLALELKQLTDDAPAPFTQRAGASDIKPKGFLAMAMANLSDPARRQGGHIGGVPEDFPKLKSESVSSVKNTTKLPKIEERFVENFPELGKADNLDEIRTRTRGTISNAESLSKAKELGYTEDRILKIPEGKALNAEEKLAVSGVVENSRLTLKSLEEQLSNLKPGTDEANSLREVMAQQRVRVYKLMAVERGVASEAGRALQAHKATITAIEQQERTLAKQLNDPKVPQDVKDYIIDRISKFDGTPDEIAKLLRELHQASKLDMFVEFATAAKLWAPATHLVNTISSTTRMLLNSPLHGISAIFDSIISKLTGRPRERFLSDATAEIQGQIQGWKHAGHEASKALMDESYAFEARKLKDFQPKGVAIKGRPGKNELQDKILNGFGKAVRTPFRILGVEDIVIRKPSEMGAMFTAINRKARMKGLKPGTKEWDTFVSETTLEPSLEMMEEIQKIADENLFQETLHPTLKRMSDWREDVPALKLVVPFFRTIVNLQKQAIEFSALAPILPSVRKGLKAGGGAQSDAIAKMTLGTAVTLPLTYHALEGNIVLAAPTNPSERDKFYAEGKQPYSIKFGEKWYPFQRFSPYSEWFVSAAAIAEAANNDDEKTQSEIMSHIFFTMTQNFFDKSFATGMHDFLEALSNPERADNWLNNFATGALVPNFIPLVARTVDPVIRESSNLKDAFVSKVPYLSKTLPAKTDVFGKPISRTGSAVERLISPIIPSPVAVDTVRTELDSIGYNMGFPGKTAGGFKMDDETYRIYQSASGKVVYAALFEMIQNPGYQALAPIQKEKAVEKIVRDVRDAVKQQVAQEQLIMQEIKSELKRQGYSTSQADDLAVKTYEVIKSKQVPAQQ